MAYMRRVMRLTALLIGVALISTNSAIAAEANLGLALDVIPSSDPSIAKLTQGQALWFVIPPGSTKFRDVRVTSSANVSEKIELSIGFLNRIDGVATLDDSKKSETEPWANFSPNNFVLKPGQSKVVRFGYSVPADTEIGIHEAFLFATASEVDSKNKAEYRVPQKARIASPIFLGVGTTTEINTDFSIDDISGVFLDGLRQLKVDLTNTGKTPLNLTGSVQLSSVEFKGLYVGPLSFTSVVIRPGESGYVLIPAPNELTPGEWKILVTASQVSTTKTREFTKNLSFDPPSNLLSNTLKGIFAAMFFGIFLIALRVIRKPRKELAEELKPSLTFQATRKKRGNIRKRKTKSIEDLELEKLIDGLMQRRINKATTKKATTKKATTKKATTKKATTKKATTKKATTKKAVKNT